ncbi:MAG TPA: hypothetical protein VMX13_14035 [Sedimentisphaerales bacterium]|nr:hypothetical protein [Sedimentisphaerales bacterium]
MGSSRLFTIICIAAVLLSVFFSPSRVIYALVNYDRNPDLTEAMEHDQQTNRGDREKADRSKAEYYYLRYLEDANQSFQRARVYSLLAGMYSTAFNPEKGEKRDLQKAREYYRKVLEEEPERIGDCTIVARNMLASLETMGEPSFERVKARMAMYEWLSEIDEKKLKQKFLPETPGWRIANMTRTVPDSNSPAGYTTTKSTRIKPVPDYNIPSRSDIIGLTNLIRDLKEGAVYNAAYDAQAMEEPDDGFLYILGHLPPDAPGRRTVQRVMQKRIDPATDEILRAWLDSMAPDANDPNRTARRPDPRKDIIVRQRLIPHVEHAKANGQPFVFDLESGKCVSVPYKETLDDQKLHEYLIRLGKGDLVWNGKILALRNARAFSAPHETQKPLVSQAGKYVHTYALPDKIVSPYTLLVSDYTDNRYIIKIIRIETEGITILYRRIVDSEIELHKYILEMRR